MLRENNARPAAWQASGRARRALATVASGQLHSITIYAQGKPVGDVRDGTFRKRCRASVHMLRKPRGWALDIESLGQAERAGATIVQIEDTESGRVYRASIESIRDNGIPLDRGFGEQLSLPLSGWTVRDRRQMSFFPEVA